MATDTEDVVPDVVVDTTSSDYARGFADGHASRDEEVDALQRIADTWYFRANNPKSEWPEVKMVESIIQGREAKEERERVYAELDRIEGEAIEHARRLIAETDMTDVAIATKVGLFAGMIANIREGVL